MLIIVDLKISGLELTGGSDGLVCKARAGMSDGGAYACKQLACAEGFCYIVVRAEVQGLDLVALMRAG